MSFFHHMKNAWSKLQNRTAQTGQIKLDYIGLPEDGASNVPKHVGARWYTNIWLFECISLVCLSPQFEKCMVKTAKYYVHCLEFNIQVRHALKEVKQSLLGHHQSPNYYELHHNNVTNLTFSLPN
jgi:hypothetical protein